MNSEDRSEIRASIIGTIASLKEEMLTLAENAKPIAPDCSLGRLTRLEAMQEQELNVHRHHEAGIRLNRLQYALRKVDTSEYGICLECEELIPTARMKLMPETSLCIRCANELSTS